MQAARVDSLRLPPQLTHDQADACVAELLKQARTTSSQGPAVVDVSALDVFDSSAVAVLLALRRALQADGRTLQLLNTPARLRELVALYGVGELLPA